MTQTTPEPHNNPTLRPLAVPLVPPPVSLAASAGSGHGWVPVLGAVLAGGSAPVPSPPTRARPEGWLERCAASQGRAGSAQPAKCDRSLRAGAVVELLFRLQGLLARRKAEFSPILSQSAVNVAPPC